MDVDLDRCTRGDKRAWDAFVERWSALIYTTVRRVSGGGADAADLEDRVQEVFVRLIRNDYRLLRSYDPKRASLSTWLTLVARSVAIDQLRKRRVPTTSFDAPGVAETPAETPPEQEPAAAPLHLLTERQRLVLRLLFDEGMTVAEAARTIGVDEQTIRSTKHKALARMREHVAGPPGSEGMP